jgi:hypothetical protein
MVEFPYMAAFDFDKNMIIQDQNVSRMGKHVGSPMGRGLKSP